MAKGFRGGRRTIHQLLTAAWYFFMKEEAFSRYRDRQMGGLAVRATKNKLHLPVMRVIIAFPLEEGRIPHRLSGRLVTVRFILRRMNNVKVCTLFVISRFTYLSRGRNVWLRSTGSGKNE